jgi:hypothetical protein
LIFLNIRRQYSEVIPYNSEIDFYYLYILLNSTLIAAYNHDDRECDIIPPRDAQSKWPVGPRRPRQAKGHARAALAEIGG